MRSFAQPSIVRSFLLIIISEILIHIKADTNSFVVHFQESGKWSSNEFLEYKGSILSTVEEFTACHWEKLNYFSPYINNIWNYCEVTTKEDPRLKCINAATMADNSTGGRDALFYLWIDGWTATPISIKFAVSPYFHRSWNHFCWTYSSKTGKNILYHNGVFVATKSSVDEHGSKGPAIKSRADVYDASIILGQEQDTMRGKYDPTQAFYGQLAEFNMWDRVLDQNVISKMGQCISSFQRGNLIKWDRSNFKIAGVGVEDVEDPKTFCRETHNYIIFPEKLSLFDATTTCSKHGASIVAPQSSEENEEVVQILAKHESKCVERRNFVANNKGQGIWLGLQKKNRALVQVNHMNDVKPVNFTNWDLLYKEEEPKVQNGFCPFMYSDGAWGYERLSVCESTKLCTICSFKKTPIFTLKGQCPNSSTLEWNYYLTTKPNYQLSHFEGYTQFSKISFTGNAWKKTSEKQSSSAKQKDILKTRGAKTPIGRLEWYWYDESCSIGGDPKWRNFTFSMCDLKYEFTCTTGLCVGLSKRCNGIKDCSDGSDEEECSHVDIPRSYRKLDPPESADKTSPKSTRIFTQVVLEGIDFVDTHDMKIGITLKVSMTWADNRLRLKNIDREHLLSKETTDQLWLPLDHVKHEEAIIGKVRADSKRMIAASPLKSSMSVNPYEIREDAYYDKNNNQLEMAQRFKIDYKCLFKVHKYPFDQHECHIALRMMPGQENVNLIEYPPPSLLTGSKQVKDFEIVMVKTCKTTYTNHQHSFSSHHAVDHIRSVIYHTDISHINRTQETFTIIIQLKRDSKDHILTLFGPTILFWLLAYLTLFFNIDDINNRSRTSVTVLLVVVSLLSSVKSEFPKTTYFKYIDLWFFWYVGNIFVIISLHIILENVDIPISNDENFDDSNQVSPKVIQSVRAWTSTINPVAPINSVPIKSSHAEEQSNKEFGERTKKEGWLSMELINRFFKVSLPIATTIFNIIYFKFTGALQDLSDSENCYT